MSIIVYSVVLGLATPPYFLGAFVYEMFNSDDPSDNPFIQAFKLLLGIALWVGVPYILILWIGDDIKDLIVLCAVLAYISFVFVSILRIYNFLKGRSEDV